MAWSVVGLEGPAWGEAIARLPDHDVYHTPQWHATFEGGADRRRSMAYVCDIGGELLLYPFRVGSIDEGLSDVEAVYGYSGPLASSADPAFLREAWVSYDCWAREQGIVCEFFRFNPFLENTCFAPPDTRVTTDRLTVWIDLAEGPDALWSGYEQTQRWSVRKAERSGLVCLDRPLSVNPAAFASFYSAAMAEIGAAEFYFFPEEYFVRLAELLGERIREFRVMERDRLLASALFICWGKRFHYHLSATPRETRAACPTNLLLHKAALWAIERGFNTMHLGGGVTSDPSDKLLAFKRQFSKLRAEYCIGRRVLDPDTYNRLCDAWLAQNPTSQPAHFPLYRLLFSSKRT